MISKNMTNSYLPVIKKMPNPCAQEADTLSERLFWAEAAGLAERVYDLATIAMAYHNRIHVKNGILPQPVGWELARFAERLASAEQCALAIRKYKAEKKESRKTTAKKKGAKSCKKG